MVVGGMGAGSQAQPDQLKQLKKQCGWLRELKAICEFFYPEIPCRVYARKLLKKYTELILASPGAMESIKRVIDACNVNVPLVEFAPVLKDTFSRLKEAAERREDEETIELVERLRKMSVADFLREWEDVFIELEAEEYEESAELYDAVMADNRLVETLERELREIAAARGINMKELLKELEREY